MKILQVIFSLAPGGAERFVVDLCNTLANQGHEISLCVLLDDKKNPNLSFYKHLLDEKVNYINMGSRNGFSLQAFIKIHKLLIKLQPNIIHCHLNVIPYFFIIAYFNKKIKIFHTLHSLAHATVSKVQFPINKYFYKSDRIHPITISNLCDKSYIQFYKLSNSSHINNGRSNILPTSEINKVKNEINSYKIFGDELIFIHVARYNKLKNQRLLIDAFNFLNQENLHFTLLVIGQDYDSIEGKKLQEISSSNIKFLGPKQNIEDYFLLSNAFCLTSEYEGLPISLLEALACGCVPICTPVGGIPDVVKNNVTGYLAEDVSLESYLIALKSYIDNPEAIKRTKLIEYFLNNFSIDICSQKYLHLFETHLSNPSASIK